MNNPATAIALLPLLIASCTVSPECPGAASYEDTITGPAAHQRTRTHYDADGNRLCQSPI